MNFKDQAFCKAFGERLRDIRLQKGFSMRKFALEADIEYSQLSKIERGVINTSIANANRLAEALGVSVKELFDFKVVKTRR